MGYLAGINWGQSRRGYVREYTRRQFGGVVDWQQWAAAGGGG